MAELKPDDLLLINRSNQSYKVTGQEVSDSLNPSRPPVIGSVTLTEDDPTGDRYTDQGFTTNIAMTDPGEEPATLSLRAKVEGTLTTLNGGTEIDNATRYLNLDASLNVIGLTTVDSYTKIPGNSTSAKITFPALLDNGQSPDDTLADGTTIQTEVEAVNSSATVTELSNQLTPRASCISGVIETDEIVGVAGNTLTFATNKDLEKLQPGDYIEPDNVVDGGQVYSQYADNSNMVRDWQSAFDGTTATNAASVANGGRPASTLNISPPITNITSLKIWVTNSGKRRANSAFWINGTQLETPDTGDGWNTFTGITEIYSLGLGNYQDGGDTFSTDVHAVNVNGSILVDGTGREPRGIVGSIDAAADSLTLSSSNGTWGPANAGHYAIGPYYQCPARILDSNVPADVADFNAVKAGLESYDAERIAYRASLRQQLRAAGVSITEMATLNMIEQGELARSINGYYPLYTTEADANNAGDGTSHTHIFDGVTYYMPDSGVTIYHGNYTD